MFKVKYQQDGYRAILFRIPASHQPPAALAADQKTIADAASGSEDA